MAPKFAPLGSSQHDLYAHLTLLVGTIGGSHLNNERVKDITLIQVKSPSVRPRIGAGVDLL